MTKSRWSAVGAGMSFQAITFGTSVYSFTFFVIPWKDEFQVDIGLIMSASLLMSVGAGILGPPVAKLLERLSVRTVVLLGFGLYGVGLLTASAAPAFWLVMVAYGILIGPGIACAGPLAGQVLVGQTISVERRGLAFGLVLTGTSIGGIIFPPLVSAVTDSFGWRVALASLAPLSMLLTLPLVWVFVPRQKPFKPAKPTTEETSCGGVPLEQSFAHILADAFFWATIIAVVPAMICFVAVQYHLDPFARSVGIGRGETSLMMSSIAASMILSKIGCGYLADRWDPRYLCLAALPLMIVALLILSTSPKIVGLGLACALIGASSGSFLPLLAAGFAQRFPPKVFARAMGLAMPFLATAGIGGFVGSLLVDSTDSYGLMFLYLAVLVVAGAAGGILILSSQRIRNLRWPAKA